MRYRATDEQGDMRPILAAASLLAGREAVAAALKSRLRLYQGEWWEDESAGFALLNSMIDGTAQANALDHMITGYILETEGVQSVKDVSVTQSGRQAVYRATVICSDGEIQLEVSGHGVQSALS